MLAVVIIAISPVVSDADPNVQEMLAACTAGLHAGSCVLEPSTSEQGGAHAQVTWTSATEVRIEVTKGGGTPAAMRSLRFQSADEARERWRTVGFTAALMVGDVQPASAPAVSESRVQLFGLATFGNGLATAPRAGAALGLDLFPWQVPLSLGASAEYSVTPGDAKGLGARWMGMAAGLGWRVVPEPELAATLRAQALLQHRQVHGTRGRDVDFASEWVLGARAQLDVVWPAQETWAGVVSFDASLFNGATEIVQENKHVSELPSFAASVGVGLRCAL